MIQQIQDLVQFYAQKYHVPIDLVTEKWQTDTMNSQHITVALPRDASEHKVLGDMVFSYDLDYAKELGGDLVVAEDTPLARIGPQWLVLLFWPKNQMAWTFAKRLLDQHLPKTCRQHRHILRDALVESITSCVSDRKRELQISMREDQYEVERLSLEITRLSRKLEGDRQALSIFQRAPEWIRHRANHTFVDLMKLVPSIYSSFQFESDTVVGITHEIIIPYDGYDYHFDAYNVEVNLRQGKVFISGGTNVNDYIHPHATSESSNICWGNIGHLVSRLAGELDLFGLFQLVYQFLTTYNANDPYQRIEKWDPDWVDDEDNEPYCSWCDENGHDISECESCWWCEHCQQYDDHAEENCPNRPREEEEVTDELVEETA